MNNRIDVFEKNLNQHWHIVLLSIIIFVLLFFLLKESFGPYTSGAGLRINSIDSSTNRGRSGLPYY